MTDIATASALAPVASVPRIQNYLSLDSLNHVAVKLAAYPFMTASFVCEDETIRDRLRHHARLLVAYGDWVESQYTDDDRREAGALLLHRGQPLVPEPACIEHGDLRIWYGHAPARWGSLAGEQLLTVVIHDDQTEPTEGECPLNVETCVAHAFLVEHILGHWECAFIDIHPYYGRDGVEHLILDTLPDILPPYADAVTLLSDHIKPAPTSVMNQREYDLWCERAPRQMKWHAYASPLDVWVSYRQARLGKLVSSWTALKAAHDGPGVTRH